MRAGGRIFIDLLVRGRMRIAEFPVLELELSPGIHGELFGVCFAGFVSVGSGLVLIRFRERI